MTFTLFVITFSREAGIPGKSSRDRSILRSRSLTVSGICITLFFMEIV